MTKHTHCPKCDAELPRKGRFCLECGLDLYEEGLRRPPSPWFPLLVVALVVGGVVAFVATRPRQPKAPPEERRIRELTTELLRLAHEGDYDEIVRRFCQPDEARYAKTGELLREVVRGAGAPGLNVFRATCMNSLDEAEKFVGRYATTHPALMMRMLAAITFEDGALRTSFGGIAVGDQRTGLFLAWFLGLAFGEADTGEAKVADLAWRDGLDGERLLVATVHYPEPVSPLSGVPEPTVIPWRQIGDGKWALALVDETHLQELLALLRRVKI